MSQDLRQSFRNFVAREQLFTHDDKLLLACSGGLDSTVLAHLLHAEGYNFDIAHMNFQLRGEESDGDAAFVEHLAGSLGARFWIKAVDVKAEAKDGESTQMTARRLRYDWFVAIRERQELDFILTAHHLDDSLETQLINFLRGTGIVGLGGLRPRLGSIVRPLLSNSRKVIQRFATDKQISWREDISNESDDYLRNEIRHHLTPLLRERFGLADKTITKNTVNLRGAEDFYFAGLEAEKEKRRKVKGEVVTIIREEDWSFATELTFLHNVVMPYYDFTRDQMEQVCSLPSNRFLDSKTHRIYATPGKWVVTPITTLNRLEGEVINELPFLVSTGMHSLQFEVIRRPESLHLNTNDLYLAPPSFPLHLRPRQNGDRFQPLGLNGRTKKVKDYMIDAKIPVWLRDRIYLLTDANDEIMAIPGYCISEKFKVLPEHKEVLRISWR